MTETTTNFNIEKFGTHVMLDACMGLGVIARWNRSKIMDIHQRVDIHSAQQSLIAISKRDARFYAKGVLSAAGWYHGDENVHAALLTAQKERDER